MGQGSDSCGGWEVEYDPYADELDSGVWVQKDGKRISISAMTSSHLINARRIAAQAAARASFEDKADQWNRYVQLFTRELASRSVGKDRDSVIYVDGSCKQPVRGAKVTMRCHCGEVYLARDADIARGWGKSCSKSCAATRRDYGRPAAKKVQQQINTEVK